MFNISFNMTLSTHIRQSFTTHQKTVVYGDCHVHPLENLYIVPYIQSNFHLLFTIDDYDIS